MEKMETVRLNRQQIHSESKNKFSFLVFFIVQTRKWDFQADSIILSHFWSFSIIFSFKFFTGQFNQETLEASQWFICTVELYRKNSIDRPGGIHFFSTHNFRITCHRTIIKSYSDRKVSTLSEYVFIFVLLCMIQKLCVEKKWIPPGLSIEILRYNDILKMNPVTNKTTITLIQQSLLPTLGKVEKLWKGVKGLSSKFEDSFHFMLRILTKLI